MLRPGLLCQECARSAVPLPPFPGFVTADAKPPSISVSPLESAFAAVRHVVILNALEADLTRAWNALLEARVPGNWVAPGFTLEPTRITTVLSPAAPLANPA